MENIQKPAKYKFLVAATIEVDVFEGGGSPAEMKGAQGFAISQALCGIGVVEVIADLEKLPQFISRKA